MPFVADAPRALCSLSRKKPMNLNKDQREGIAKVSDNLATACMVAAIVGGVVDQKIGWVAALFLFGMFGVLLFAGISLRKQKGDEDGN